MFRLTKLNIFNNLKNRVLTVLLILLLVCSAVDIFIGVFDIVLGETTIVGSITDLTYPYNTTTQNEVAMFKANWTTSGTLDSFWWEHDFADGENYVNQSASAFSGTWGNASFTLPNSIDTFHIRCRVNATDGTENVTSEITITTVSEHNIYLEENSYATVQVAENLMDDYDNSTVHLCAGNTTWGLAETVINQESESGYGVNFIGYDDGGCLGHDDDWELNSASTILFKEFNASSVDAFFKFGSDSVHGNYVNNPIRVSGIHFQAEDPTNASVEIDTTRGIQIIQIPDFRVDHCTFESLCQIAIVATSNDGHVGENVSCYGVVDHCAFNNTYKSRIPDCVWGYGVYSSGTAANDWNPDTSVFRGKYGWVNGTTITYVEDCRFKYMRHATDGSQYGWITTRFCLVEENVNNYVCAPIDNHGGESFFGRGAEAYNNTVYGFHYSYYDWEQESNHGFKPRGGSWILTNNTVIFPEDSVYNRWCLLSTGDDEGIQTSYSLNETYIWDNTVVNGTFEVETFGVSGSLDENDEYFLRAPNNEDDGFSYTPYPYPHPLVSDESPTYYYLDITSETGGSTSPSGGVEHEYLDGTNVTVTATADTGYSFVNWTDGDTSNPRYVLMTSNQSLTPAFFDLTAPTTSDYGHDTTEADRLCTLYAEYEDAIGLSGYIVSVDNGNGLANETWVAIDGTPTSNRVEYEFTNNATVGQTIQYVIYANDTSDNWGTTEVQEYDTTSAWLWGWGWGWWVVPSIAGVIIVILKKVKIENEYIHLAAIVVVEDLLLRILPIILLQDFIPIWSIFIISVIVDTIVHSINKWNIIGNRFILALIYNSIWFTLFVLLSPINPILGFIACILFHYCLDAILLWRTKHNVK